MAGGATGWAIAGGGAARTGGGAGRATGAAGPGGPPLPWFWANAPTLTASIETPTKKAVRQTQRGSMIVAPSQ
jgi:hypothetical protein